MENENPTHEEFIKHRRRLLNEIGASTALAHLVRANQEQQRDFESHGGYRGIVDPLSTQMYFLAEDEANRILGLYEPMLVEQLVDSPVITFVAALGEPILRDFLRHLMYQFFGWCGELDGMVDCLVEMNSRRRKMPIEVDIEELESWWSMFRSGAVAPEDPSLDSMRVSLGE